MQPQVMSLSQLMDGPREIEWIVDDLIPRRSSTLVVGNSGIGKTWITLDLALSVATGAPWLGMFPTQQRNVLIVDEENDVILLRDRLYRMVKSRGLDITKVPLHFMVGQAIDLSPLEGRDGSISPSPTFISLMDTVNSLDIGIVILDSLRRVNHNNENDSSEMSLFFAQVKRLINETGVSTVFNHHVNKGEGNNGFRIRGSTDIPAFQDCTILIEKVQDRVLSFKHDKARWGKEVDPFVMEMLIGDESFTVAKMEVPQKLSIDNFILSLISRGEVERQEILNKAEEHEFSARTVSAALKKLVQYGKATKRKEGHSTLYCAADLTPLEMGL